MQLLRRRKCSNLSKVISTQEFASSGEASGPMRRKRVQKLMDIADFELRMFELLVRKIKCPSI